MERSHRGRVRTLGKRVVLNGARGFESPPLLQTLYDVQQLLKQFGVVVYLGKRLYDIEMMKIELEALYKSALIDKENYLIAEMILRREHQIEMEKENE